MARKKSVLTEQKEVLMNAMLDGKPVTQAAKDAGYSDSSSAYRALRAPEMKDYLDKARSQLSDALQLKRVDIIEGIMDAIQIARMATDPGSMIRGYSEIAKMLGMYEPEKKVIELTANQGRIRQKFETMSDEELLQLMESPVYEGEATHVN